jgi:hypothetical protein
MLPTWKVLTLLGCLRTELRNAYFCSKVSCYRSGFVLFLFEGVFRRTTASKKRFWKYTARKRNISNCLKKLEGYQKFMTETRASKRVLVMKWELLTRRYRTALPVKGQGVSVKDEDREASCHRLRCEMSDTIKGQLTNRVSLILKQRFLWLPDFGNFENYSDIFPGVTYELWLKLHGRYFDFVPVETGLSVIIRRKTFYKVILQTSHILSPQIWVHY